MLFLLFLYLYLFMHITIIKTALIIVESNKYYH